MSKEIVIVLNTESTFSIYNHFLDYCFKINYPIVMIIQALLPVFYQNITVVLEPNEIEFLINHYLDELNLELFSTKSLEKEKKERLYKFIYCVYINIYISIQKLLINKNGSFNEKIENLSLLSFEKHMKIKITLRNE